MLDRTRHDERAPGATFALGDLVWLDFETASRVPIGCGSDKYSRNADAIILAWAIGDGPVHTEAVADFPATLRWADMPGELRAALADVSRETRWCVAHGATFDRSVWNNSTIGFPFMEPRHLIDTRVQAQASGLPAALADAVRKAGGEHLKNPRGKDLIKLFSDPATGATPQTHSEEWAEFVAYARDDIEAMRDLFKRTRQLPLAEWKEYWAAEAINDGGVAIDLAFVEAAADMAAIDRRASGHELARLTGGAVDTVDKIKCMRDWLKTVLPSDGRDILIKTEEVVDLETGEISKPAKEALDRDRVTKLLAYLASLEPLSEPLKAAQRLLQIRLYGGSKTPAKFGRMAAAQVDGIIRGQYVFNGAGQTGRFSARGIQVHNLARDKLPYELDAIDALVAGADAKDFAALGDDTPISRKLSLLIRPSLVAEPGNAFVWGDWSNIEARITPWLADDPEADQRLALFEAFDKGKEKYDVYTHSAAALSGISLEAVDEKIRQRGKVVELACGFGGSTNALLSMAASYGMHLSEEEAKAAVARWRDANPWAPRFWADLWQAATTALTMPDTFFPVGRVGYLYKRDYLGGSLFCRLPSGRFLTYRRIGWQMVEQLDDDGMIVDVRRELMFSRDMGRIKLWPGLLCENITQAAAADILRGTLRRLEEYPGLSAWMPTCLHTHDEVVVETEERRAADAAALLRRFMVNGFDWTAGLPIAADTVTARFYTKNKQSMGL